MTTFRAGYPQVRVDVTGLATPSLELALLEGHVDVGIVHPPLSRPGLARRQLKDEALVLVVPADHRLAGVEGPVGPGQLDGERLILHPRWLGPSLHDRVMAYLREGGAEPVLASAVSPLTGVAAAVAAGGGVGLVTQSLASPRAASAADVRFVPLAGPAPMLPVAVAWREGASSDLVESFVALCLT